MSVMRCGLAVGCVFAATSAVAQPICGGLVDKNGRMLLIKKSESKCGWPFSADLVGIVCVPKAFLGGNAVYAIAHGAAYPLNGNAKDAGPLTGFRNGDIREIAENDSRTAGWIKPGLQLCGVEPH